MHPLLAVISMPLDPIIVRIGGLSVHWYGLFIALGILVNVPIARRECARKGISEDLVFNLAVWGVIFGIIGGRLYYVIQADQPGGFKYYLTHPGQILATWEGGMAFYGMVFAVFVTVLVYCRVAKAPFWDLLDMGALFFPLGQTFGRLGNVVNGDIVGYPSNLPWAIRYPHPNALAPDHETAFQPASVYELLFSLALFLLLWSIRKRVKTPGLLFAFYVFLYSLGQFGIFYLRDNPITALDLKQAQITALAVMLATLPLMAYLLRRPRGATAAQAAASPDSTKADASLASQPMSGGDVPSSAEGTQPATRPERVANGQAGTSSSARDSEAREDALSSTPPQPGPVEQQPT